MLISLWKQKRHYIRHFYRKDWNPVAVAKNTNNLHSKWDITLIHMLFRKYIMPKNVAPHIKSMYFFLNISQMCLLLVKLWMIILTLFGRVTRMIKFVSPRKTNQINSSIHVMDTVCSDFPWHWLCLIQGSCTNIHGLLLRDAGWMRPELGVLKSDIT